VDIRSDEFISINATMSDPNTSPYWQMSNTNWYQPYEKKYVSGRGDLYLIIDLVAFSTSQQYDRTLLPDDLHNLTIYNSRDFIRPSTAWLMLRDDDELEPGPKAVHVAQAFSKKMGPQSRVQISLYFMVIVLVFNMLKLAVMTLVLLTDQSTYLVTFGDAVASFLKRPDQYTDRMCMLGKEEFFAKMGLLPLHPISDEEEANDLRQRSMGTWLPQPQSYMFSINRHGKVVYTIK
jgi:hypothetical protein